MDTLANMVVCMNHMSKPADQIRRATPTSFAPSHRIIRGSCGTLSWRQASSGVQRSSALPPPHPDSHARGFAAGARSAVNRSSGAIRSSAAMAQPIHSCVLSLRRSGGAFAAESVTPSLWSKRSSIVPLEMSDDRAHAPPWTADATLHTLREAHIRRPWRRTAHSNATRYPPRFALSSRAPAGGSCRAIIIDAHTQSHCTTTYFAIFKIFLQDSVHLQCDHVHSVTRKYLEADGCDSFEHQSACLPLFANAMTAFHT